MNEGSRQFVYILECADESYYTGFTADLDARLAQHNAAEDSKAYTASRLPVELVWSTDFPDHDSAFRCERQIKGWSRAKKAALIEGRLAEIHDIVRDEWERKLRASNELRAAARDAD